MQRAALLTACLLAVAGCATALQCYSCNSRRDIVGVSIAANIRNELRRFPPCDEFDPYNPQQKFIQECPLLIDKGCMKVVDPHDSNNILRSCFLVSKNECERDVCHCTGELCNSAAGATAALLLVLPAALLRLL